MAAALFGKKASADTEAPDPSGGSQPSDLDRLTSRLADLGQELAEAQGQIADYLRHRESQAVAAARDEALRDALKQEIAALAEKVDKLASGTPSPSGAAGGGPDDRALIAVLDPLKEKLDRIEAGLKTLSGAPAKKEDAAGAPSTASVLDAVRQLEKRLETGLGELVDLLTPNEEPARHDSAPSTSGQWERAIVGPDLAEHPALAFERGRLINGVLEGDPGACALAGQLLVFQSAPAERLPQLLKDIGEAFYRWQPKTASSTNPVEEALVEWLQRHCEAAGIHNTIALVHRGERFDSTRHTAASRGVEITKVHGWVVLRDNGKVYTKAAVSVR